jgi:hypothetical protein
VGLEVRGAGNHFSPRPHTHTHTYTHVYTPIHTHIPSPDSKIPVHHHFLSWKWSASERLLTRPHITTPGSDLASIKLLRGLAGSPSWLLNTQSGTDSWLLSNSYTNTLIQHTHTHRIIFQAWVPIFRLEGPAFFHLLILNKQQWGRLWHLVLDWAENVIIQKVKWHILLLYYNMWVSSPPVRMNITTLVSTSQNEYNHISLLQSEWISPH